ncbi:hypothetical protein ACFO8Q_23515 [Effusibacillus consociatus]|uniref:Uncharacterized protein n=1 Tax=Effusibacillus consociatus TaxID=1117041 RepID=A0ABV9Q8T9_9BACL
MGRAEPVRPELESTDTLEELVIAGQLGTAEPFRADVWRDGGYPFGSPVFESDPAAASRWTVFAKKMTCEM